MLPVRKPAHLRPQRRVLEPRRVTGHRVAGGQMLAEHATDRVQSQPAGRRIAARERQLELELVEPVRAGDVA